MRQGTMARPSLDGMRMSVSPSMTELEIALWRAHCGSPATTGFMRQGLSQSLRMPTSLRTPVTPFTPPAAMPSPSTPQSLHVCLSPRSRPCTPVPVLVRRSCQKYYTWYGLSSTLHWTCHGPYCTQTCYQCPAADRTSPAPDLERTCILRTSYKPLSYLVSRATTSPEALTH